MELGILGMVVGILFLIVAKEAHGAREVMKQESHPLGKGMRRKVLAIAAILGCRDFAGIATSSLVSIYLQKAHGYDARHTGWVIGAMMLTSMVANPISVFLSPGQRRLPALMINLLIGGTLLVLVPRINVGYVLLLLAIFQIFHLGSYAIGEAAMLERVHPDVRGRVIGLFLTSAGTFASLSPWVMGWWTDHLGARALRPEGYYIPFALLGAMMVFAGFSVKMIARLGPAPTVADQDVMQAMAPTIEA